MALRIKCDPQRCRQEVLTLTIPCGEADSEIEVEASDLSRTQQWWKDMWEGVSELMFWFLVS